MSPRTLAALLVVSTLLVARTAPAADPDRVEWSNDWPRVRLWEVADALVLTIADTEIEQRVPVTTPARWRGGILFDDWARSVFRASGPGAQSTASTVSDWIFYGGTLAPFILDDYFVTLEIHRNADVALQMLVINMQSLGVSGLVSLVAEHGVGRARPYTDGCGPDGTIRDSQGQVLPNRCGGPNDDRSFFSGHVAAVTTMASLTCVHHQHLPLYGGGFADLAPCLAMIGLSTTTGILRLVYDEHWASDVITGWAMGALAGYVLPSVLHYGFGGGRAIGEIRAGGVTAVPVPTAYAGGAGLALAGAF